MTQFERTVLNEIARIRRSLFDLDVNSFIFTITASGRLHEGDVAVVFRLENLYDSKANVEGNSIDEVVEEYKRRNGWVKRNTGLLLSPPAIEHTLGRGALPDDDKIPF